MTRRLLEDCFQLKVSTEARVMRTYALSPAKTGMKLNVSSSEGQGEMSQGGVQGKYRVSARRMPLTGLIGRCRKRSGGGARDRSRSSTIWQLITCAACFPLGAACRVARVAIELEKGFLTPRGWNLPRGAASPVLPAGPSRAS